MITYLSDSLLLYRFWAKVVQVFPPKPSTDAAATLGASSSKQASTSTSPESVLSPMSDDEQQSIHKLSGDLKVPAKEVNAKDDPTKYFYKVQILEEQNEKSHEKSKTSAKDRAKWSGSLMEVQCSVMRCVAWPVPVPTTDSFLITAATALRSQNLSCVVLCVTVWTAILRLHHLGLSSLLSRNDTVLTRKCLRRPVKGLRTLRRARSIRGRRHGKTRRVHQQKNKRR
jgi:hypothetical protein